VLDDEDQILGKRNRYSQVFHHAIRMLLGISHAGTLESQTQISWIGCVGRLVYEKGFLELFAAAAELV